MNFIEVIGRIGADAKVEVVNGDKFVSFRVAETDRYTDRNGNQVENTTWYSCALDGDGGRLLPFLRKGVQVYVLGRCSARVYSSRVERRMVAGINISVRHIELLGGDPRDVPTKLYDVDGVEHAVGVVYFASDVKNCRLQDLRGRGYVVDKKGWVTPEPPAEQPATTQQ